MAVSPDRVLAPFPDWVRQIRDRCLRAKVPFFFKQWGGVVKSRSGRLLDGRTWDEMPSGGAAAAVIRDPFPTLASAEGLVPPRSTRWSVIPALSQAFVWRSASSASRNNLSSLRQTMWLPIICPRSFDPAGRLPRGILADTPSSRINSATSSPAMRQYARRRSSWASSEKPNFDCSTVETLTWQSARLP